MHSKFLEKKNPCSSDLQHVHIFHKQEYNIADQLVYKFIYSGGKVKSVQKKYPRHVWKNKLSIGDV